MYEISNRNVENHFVRSMYKCYADILLVILPFLVVNVAGSWSNDDYSLLTTADMAIAACILAGMSIGRFMLSLIQNPFLTRYKLRFILLIALILTVLIGPSMVSISQSLRGIESPDFLLFLQPLLLFVAIALYSISFNVSYLMTKVISEN